MTRWGLSHPLPPATPATSTPSTCDASHIKPQRVITTRWGLSLPLHLRRQPHQPPTSQNDSLGALSPPPPATLATSTLNESLRLVEGSLSPSTCDASHINPQRVILTRWGLSLPLHLRPRPHQPLHLRRQPHQPPTSHYDSLGALSTPPPATTIEYLLLLNIKICCYGFKYKDQFRPV